MWDWQSMGQVPRSCARIFAMLHEPGIMLGAPVSAVWCINTCFFVFLGVCFHIRCLGTWKWNSSLSNVFWGLLNLHSWSFQILHKSSDVLLCRFAWFLRELHQNTVKLLCFGKNIITCLKYRKYYQCPEIIRNFSKTPIIYMKNLLIMTKKHAKNNVRWLIITTPNLNCCLSSSNEIKTNLSFFQEKHAFPKRLLRLSSRPIYRINLLTSLHPSGTCSEKITHILSHTLFQNTCMYLLNPVGLITVVAHYSCHMNILISPKN